MKPPVPPEVPPPAALPEPPPELCIYRRQTCNLLRRYFNMSIELGRLPNILGREIFCQHSGASRPATFEDRVAFVHDVERCLQLLQPFDQQVIARCLFQDYSFEEAARPLQCNERTVRRRFSEGVDQITALLLDRHLLVFEARRRVRAVEENPAAEPGHRPPPLGPPDAPGSFAAHGA